jgi:fluoride ion exporter CrcB/FEX
MINQPLLPYSSWDPQGQGVKNNSNNRTGTISLYLIYGLKGKKRKNKIIFVEKGAVATFSTTSFFSQEKKNSLKNQVFFLAMVRSPLFTMVSVSFTGDCFSQRSHRSTTQAG